MGTMDMSARSPIGQTRLNFKDVVALIVDRDPYAGGLVGQMLRGFGISTIMIAGNGQEAKELLAHHKPEVVFLECKTTGNGNHLF